MLRNVQKTVQEKANNLNTKHYCMIVYPSKYTKQCVLTTIQHIPWMNVKLWYVFSKVIKLTLIKE